MDMQRTTARFATTRWTLVAALHSASSAEQAEALSSLIERYWPAVYAYLRRTGLNRDQAAEATQGFFVDVVLSRALFDKADSAAGPLRSLMLVALKRYMIDRHRRARSRRERDVISVESIEHVERRLDPADTAQPEHIFTRSWATGVLNEALARCERHFTEHGRRMHWELFEWRVLRPAVSGSNPPPLAAEAERLGFATPADAAAAVQTVKRRVNAVLGEVVAETVGCTEQIEQELALLRAALG